ncbi:MAG: DUF4872 domain-containing protein [Chloroflexota bacterium]|nr:DUF4872 domain-containing protein [Chloroflexota bacterium]MDE2839277.1 DUF4872 domain-containing protein [Chloroflexota bacterium]
MTILPGYEHFGGIHPETATITTCLRYLGVKNPATGEPFTEAMVFGIAGGLGACYILWEFKEYNRPAIVFGWQHQFNYPVRYVENFCKRIGVTSEFHETGGMKKAGQTLHDALAAGKPAILWLERELLDYYNRDPDDTGWFSWVVTACGYDAAADVFTIDDTGAAPFTVPSASLTASRQRIPSFKNRLLLLSPPESMDLPAATRDGIQGNIEYLGAKSTSFALPTLRKWARMLTDTKNAKGWPTVFAEGKCLFSGLVSVYEGIMHEGSDGTALRGMYADFLAEAAAVLGVPALDDAAAEYREIGEKWRALAEMSLDPEVESLAAARDVLDRREAAIRTGGDDQADTIVGLGKEFEAMRPDADAAFPRDEAWINDLFARMQAQISDIFAHENAALDMLREAMEG